MHLGKEGTEQFEVVTRVDGKEIGRQKIHDPFIRSTVKLRGLRHAWNALTKGITVQVAVDGTHGAERAVMTLDPYKLQADTDEWLVECERNFARRSMDMGAMNCVGAAPAGSMGFEAAQPAEVPEKP